jgi:hypothetical protein
MNIEKLTSLLKDREREASVESLADSFMENWGQVSGVMNELRLLYDSENIAKSEKVKIILAGIELVKESTEKKKGRDPIAEMSDSDMIAAMKELNEQLSLGPRESRQLPPSEREDEDSEVPADE